MSMIPWSKEYSVDIEEIDQQHKSLVGLLNKLYEAMATKQSRNDLAQILDELVSYTTTHFAVEETLMRIFHYPEYDAHKANHDHIAHKVVEFQRQFHAGKAHVDMDLLLFLKEWLTGHIQQMDKAYSPYLTERGVKRTWLRKFW